MIYKHYEIKKIDFLINKQILLYGKNNGLKTEILKSLIVNSSSISKYDESSILENTDKFKEKIFNKSFFEKEEMIIINRATDKIYSVITDISSKNIGDTIIIINADNLEKKSKLRSFFEKSKKDICIAFYPDNEQTLLKLAYSFVSEKKILISSSNVNLIVNKCNGNRENLINELKKIEIFSKGGAKITSDKINKLSNTLENYSISELIDNCLIKNKKKIIYILNENNFSNEDCILITRIFLNKSKKILNLSEQYEINKNMELTISSSKPPIFWKDKEITKEQISKWPPQKIKNLIYKLNELELLIKKNMSNSVNLINDFILGQAFA
tara:strand:+ start:4156 stop:5136 length:981 start_codon:yes stop_codon:yes gene_type:complete